MLCAHVKRFDMAPDGRLFRDQAGNYVDAAAYGIAWARAREHALTRTERTSRLAERFYDLRHARKRGSVESRLSERRLTGKSPGQAPFTYV